MLSRRAFLLGTSVCGMAAACNRRGGGAPDSPRKSSHEGIAFLELFAKGADERSPLVVAIHGMGDDPVHFAELWQSFPARAHLVFPRAFDAYGQGWSWFEFREGMTDEQFGAAVGAAEARLWKGIAKLAEGRKILVTGFSQGGILSFAIASRHPDVVLRAFPVSGSCPGPLLPQNKARAAPIVAFQGTADDVLDVKWGREAVHAFAEQGNQAELREYEGVGHTLTPQMRADLWAEIQKSLPPAGR
jgi:phospholipase/carboxylesterase